MWWEYYGLVAWELSPRPNPSQRKGLLQRLDDANHADRPGVRACHVRLLRASEDSRRRQRRRSHFAAPNHFAATFDECE
jgi:hypothetical protein